MTSDRLSLAYLEKASVRIKALKFLHSEKGYSDVIREAQECVELLLKALLRHSGVEIPKVHDVSKALQAHSKRLPQIIQDNLMEISSISRNLRKDRELSFYGSEDWIPTDEYHAEDSTTAIQATEKIYLWVSQAITA